MMKKVMATLIAVLMLSALFSGCAPENEESSVPNTSGTYSAVRPEGNAYVIVETPYGELYYQDQWEEFMRVEQTQDGSVLRVAFSADINAKIYALFTLEIGGGTGAKLGQLTDANGTKRTVYATVHTIAEDSELSADELNRLYAMQEDINYVMQYLK